jgi:hypothetical protein
MSEAYGARSKEYQALFLVWGAVYPGHNGATQVWRAKRQSSSCEETVKSKPEAGKKNRRKIFATIYPLCQT